MTINAVQSFVNGVLNNGINVPYFSKPITSAKLPPIPGVVKEHQPMAFVYALDLDDERTSIPRSTLPGLPPGIAGWKTAQYELIIEAIIVARPNDLVLDQKMPLVAETIRTTLYGTLMPANITDPTTGAWSRLMDLGEAMHIQIDPVRTLEPQQWVEVRSHLVCRVKEMFLA